MNSLPENDPALVAEPGNNDDQAATAAGVAGTAIIFIFLILALLMM
ncbi:MAG: hypothetical protein R6U29_07320 [Desulfosudaceae bacterium]